MIYLHYSVYRHIKMTPQHHKTYILNELDDGNLCSINAESNALQSQALIEHE